jgi:hypothetical protein
LQRHRIRIRFGIALACATALMAAGCKNSAGVFQDQNEGGWFSKPFDLLGKPDWARPTTSAVNLGPQGPVAPEDMVSADGRCGAPPALAQAPEPTTAPPPADRAVGSVAGDLAGAPMPAVTQASASPDSGLQRLETPSTPPVAGGIALGMTECQAVQRAGTPSNVAISATEKGDRKVVLTYLSGPWPGIYTFTGGRLQVVEVAPDQPKPAKPAPKKTPKKKPGAAKTAGHEVERTYVR